MAIKNPGKASTWVFLLLVLSVYLFDVRYRLFGGYPNHYVFIIPYMLIVVFAYALLLTPEERSANGLQYLFWFSVCSLISILGPTANGLLQYHLEGILSIGILSFVWFAVLISPAWMLYLSLFFPGERAQYLSFFSALYVLIWVSFAIVWFFPQIQAISMDLEYRVVSPVIAMDYIKDQLGEGLSVAWTNTKEQYTLFWKYVSGQLEYAVNPYASRTDNMNERKVGVYLEQPKPIPTNIFYEGMPVSVEGRIKADVIENEVNLTINCNTDENVKGELYPSKDFWPVVRFFDERVDCSFDGLPVGSHNIEMSVTIENFKTLSYLRSFFINEDSLFQLRRQGKDPLKVYNLANSDFVTIRSSGPMNVGMDLGTPPIGINTESGKVQFKLGVGLSNAWQGELKKIKELFMIVPKGFEIVGITGLGKGEKAIQKINCNFLPKEDFGLCDDQLENVYRVTQEALNYLPDNLKTSAVVFNVQIEGNPQEILQKQPFTNKYFKTTVIYDYELKKKTSVIVKKR